MKTIARDSHDGGKLNFIVADRETIEAGLVVRSAYAVISIHDPDKPPAKVRKQAGLRDVLHVAFHDSEPSAQMVLPDHIKLLTPEQAGQICQFVDSHRLDVGAVVVHCEQGMARSPAVAAALCKAMGGDDRKFWREYQPNRFVYRMILEAWQKGAFNGGGK